MNYKFDDLLKHASQTNANIKGKWVPARPKPHTGWIGLKTRLKGAWLVATGKADTFTWPGGQ